MPTVLPSRVHHTQPTQSDLDLLELLTADSTSLGPLPPRSNATSPHAQPPHEHSHPHPPRSLPRREAPLDSLLMSAVLSGSGPVTRHHVGHGIRPGSYANCDESRPSTPRAKASPVLRKSMQAPRSERLKLEEGSDKPTRNGESSTAGSFGETTTMPIRQSKMSNPPSPEIPSVKPRRKMSIDPQPVSQLLQQASPAHTNFFHSTNVAQALGTKSSGRPRVRCMARTRIPTPHGELFLHLYHNTADQKEHLAIVIDPIQLDPAVKARAPSGRREIRSRTLDAEWREGETDMERVVRGAYVGRLLPGGEGQSSKAPHRSKASSDKLDKLSSVAENGESTTTSEADILPLVRIHSECFTGETIGSMRCDCGEQLDEAIRQISTAQQVPQPVKISESALDTPSSSRSPSPSDTPAPALVPGRGVIIYMRQEGRGIGLLEKIRAYNLQDLGHDTVTANLMLGHGADERNYSVAAEIMRDLGLAGDETDVRGLGHGGVRLLTNNPEKVEGLAKEGIKISERVGMTPRDWHCPANSPKQSHKHLHGDELEDGEEREYEEWRLRRGGVGLIGAGAARGPELEKYLRTKVERMGHMIDIPDNL